MAKAHVYLLAGANVESTDTFASWVDTTNQLVYDMGTVVLTTTSYPQPNVSVGGYTSGNAHVEGLFSANTLIASTALRGGTVNASATMYVTSNTIFADSNLVQIGANTNNFTVNANNSLFTGNVAVNAASSVVTVTAANTTINAGNFYVKTPSEFTGTTTDVKGTTFTVTSNSVITSATMNANVDVITLGFNSADVLNVNSTTDFNAAVNVDGIFTSTANALFTGAQAQFDNNVILGSTTADSISVNGYLVTDLLPSAITVDLGSDAKPYGNVHTTYVYADNNIESLGELQLKGTAAKTLRVTGSDGTYQSLNITFSNNSVSNTALVANTSGLFGGIDSLYSMGSSSVKWKDVNAVDFIASNSATLGGDLAVNGGDITTTATTFNLINGTTTTLNIGSSATAVNIGATTGTATIKNPTVVGTQTTQNLWNTTATTVNAFGAATTINVGATTGTVTISNPTIVGTQTTQNLWNTTATTVNAFGAATSLNLGAATGSATISNPTVNLNGGTVATSSATFTLLNTTATTVTGFGAATTLTLGGASGAQTVTIGGSSTGASTYNLGTGATATATTKTVNLGTGGAAGSTTNVNIGSSVAGSTTLNSATITGPASVALWNAGSTAVDAFGAATTLNLGAATGTATINNATLALGGSALTTSQTTFALLNTTATTVNAFGAATAVNIGAATGTTNVKNNLDVDGDVNIDGGDLTASGTTFNMVNSGITTLNIGGAATTVNLGAATGTTTIASANVAFSGNTTTTASSTYNLFPTTATTVKAFGAATTLNLGAATGTTNVNNSLVVAGSTTSTGDIVTSGDLTVNGGDLIMSASANVVNTSTTVNSFGAATTLNIGATTGTATIKNATVALSGSALTTASTTFALLNTTATTVNAFGAATAINLGSAAATNLKVGSTTADNILTVHGNGVTGNTTITSNVTTGKFKLAPSITTGDVEIGSANAGTVKVLFTGSSLTVPDDNAITISGGAYVGQTVKVGGDTSIDGNTTINGSLTVVGKVLFSNTDLEMSVNTSIVNTTTVMEALILNSGTGAVVASDMIPSDTTFDLGSTVTPWDGVYANTVSAKTSVTAADGIKDGVVLVGSSVGSNSRRISIVPPTSAISANRTVTLPDGDVLLRVGNTAVLSDKLSAFAATTSTELRGVISDETGTGSLVFSTSPSLTTPTIGGGGAVFSGSTSGTTTFKANATAGTTTITMPATTGTMALTSDIGNGALTINVSDGLAGTNASFTANQSTASSISITNTDKGSSQNIFKSIAVGANTLSAGSNSDTFTVAGSGIVSVTANQTTKVITVAATEVDTLASVTGRGASTATALDLTNTTASTSTSTGAVKLTGGMGVGGAIHVGGASRVYNGFTIDGALSGNSASFSSDVVISGNLTINGTTTTINTAELSVDDKNIIIGDVASPTDITANGGGITLKGTTDKSIVWDSTNANWTSSENLNIPTGKVFKINNVSMLSATALGSSVVSSSLTSVGTLTSGTWNGSTIAANYGGTGFASYAVGDLLYASSTSALSKLADVATGNSLISGGVGVAPSWGKIGLTTHITGTLAIANGGTGQTTALAAFDALSPLTTLGDIIYHNGTDNVRLAGNTTTTKQFLAQTGNGTVSAAPVWSTVTKSDVGLSLVENTALSTWAGSTNITSVGTLAAGTWNATTIAVNKGGTGQTAYANGEILIGNSTGSTLSKGTIGAGQNITITNGAGTINIDAANTNMTWTAGTTAGPTLNSSTGSGAVIPSASATASGVVTTAAQTFAGAKTFNSTITGSITGNAGTATVLQTARTINGVSFNGSANIVLTANTTATLTNGSYITGSAFDGGTATTWAVDATSAATASKVVARDASGNFSANTITAALIGNAATVTNGVYTTGNQTIGGIKTFSSTISGSIDGNAGTVTNGVYTTGNQTIGGIKTFSSTISGSIDGNAGTVTNGVYTAGDQTIAGIKTFSNNIVTSAVSVGGFTDQDTVNAAFYGAVTQSASSYAPIIKLRSTGTSNVTTASLGVLHNVDNTQEAIIHVIQAADANNRIWRFTQNGDFVSPGSVTAYSDERLKTNVRTIDGALDKVSQMRGVYFDKDGKASTGVIAQEVEKVIPEVVLDGEYKSVAYGNLVGVLIEAIKELRAEITQLKLNK